MTTVDVLRSSSKTRRESFSVARHTSAAYLQTATSQGVDEYDAALDRASELEAQMAELELDHLRLQSQLGDLQAKYKSDVESWAAKEIAYEEQRELSVKKNHGLTKLEDSITELYLDTKERPGDGVYTKEGYDREKEILRSQWNAMSILNMLRTEINVFIAMRSEFQRKSHPSARNRDPLQIQNEQFRKALSEAKKIQEQYLLQIEDLKKGNEQLTQALEKAERDHKRALEKNNTDIQNFNLEVKKLMISNNALQKSVAEKEKQLGEASIFAHQVGEFDKLMKATKAKHREDTEALHKEHKVETTKMQLEIDGLNVEVLEKKKLESKLKWANDNLNSPGKYLEYQGKIERLKQDLEQSITAMEKAEAAARKSKMKCDELKKKNEQLSKELKINQMAKQKITEAAQKAPKSHDYRMLVENNHSVVEVVKRQLKEKEKELQALHNRVSRMMMAWNRGQLVQKTNDLERSNMLIQLENLRTEVSRMSSPVATITSSVTPMHSWLESLDDDDASVSSLSDKDDDEEEESFTKMPTVNRQRPESGSNSKKVFVRGARRPTSATPRGSRVTTAKLATAIGSNLATFQVKTLLSPDG
ncbi:putative MAEBL [Planoprotostelium fungivorum]|uniref:Putative MAEBL n=1 Tax=Planoprotostelium fungivorum TaxID=1890364 RepID=A0A2P6NK48_9EUKA|nr:putative MAEBL [Planoprotostelium fungivorum]